MGGRKEGGGESTERNSELTNDPLQTTSEICVCILLLMVCVVYFYCYGWCACVLGGGGGGHCCLHNNPHSFLVIMVALQLSSYVDGQPQSFVEPIVGSFMCACRSPSI